MVKKKTYKETETLVLSEDGEIINTNSTIEKVSYDREPDYIKIYIDDISRLKNVPSRFSKIMYALLKKMSYNNLIPTHQPVKESIAYDLGISVNQVRKGIQALYESGFLIRVSRGYYVADPKLFGRGAWKDIKELQLQINYDSKGRKSIQAKPSTEDNQLKIQFD